MAIPIPAINTKATIQHTYDAIVVGSGISGGWAAKELCEQGLNVLLLERGRPVEHGADYKTALMHPWQFPNRLQLSVDDSVENPVQSKCYAYNEATRNFFVNDQENPYEQIKKFNWIRGYQVGGRSLTWGRQCYRLSDLDFEANAKEAIGVDWPIRYADLAPWYAYVEKFVGISGNSDGLAHLPDGEFLPPMEMNCLEKEMQIRLRKQYQDRTMIIGRTANLSQAHGGRGPCQYRNLCARGCPYGGYFSSNSATIPAAMATGKLTIRPFSAVSEVLYDEQKKRATGVRIIDTQTKESIDYFSRIIFLNASTINTTLILLNSVSNRFPNGLGNDSDQVGRNLMDHHLSGGAGGTFDGLTDTYYKGRRPNIVYFPRFRNINAQSRQDYLRGFGYQGDGERSGWPDIMQSEKGWGTSLKEKITKPGPWTFWMGGWGETLPYEDNRVTLNTQKKDPLGLPVVQIDFEFKSNEKLMQKDMQKSALEILQACGFNQIKSFNYQDPGGTCVHEMGTARMGNDPKTSVLNAFNQVHSVPNVFITDGSAMTSSSCVNPSLTYMALTARACYFAVSEARKLNL